MDTTFKRLSIGWNAEPNSPRPSVSVDSNTVTLRFYLNASKYHQFREEDIGQIVFNNCWRYRLGGTNDEGWYVGQCRFSKIAPAWGQFYEVSGNLMDDVPLLEWKLLGHPARSTSKHFLFYLRDETFECDASDFNLSFESAICSMRPVN